MENIETKNAGQQEPTVPQSTSSVQPDFQYHEKLRMEQNLPLGILAGFGAAFLGALLWAAITVLTKFQIGYMAVAIGFAVGFSVRIFGKGIDLIFGIVGAILALLGCLAGNFFSQIGFAAHEYAVSYFEVLTWFGPSEIPKILIDSFNFMDILFYGLAIYEGFRFSFRVDVGPVGAPVEEYVPKT
jgi:hypothetical protein